MGVFYNSICIPGDRHDQVRQSVARWLHGRGFELSEPPMLFDLDGEVERNAFVLWNERWTILVFSEYDEERRLIRELQSWAPAVLYLWVQDSDVWGYDLFDPDGFAGSFNSDVRTYHSFAEDEAERPVADPERVRDALGLTVAAPELVRVQQTKAIFKEDACLEMGRLIGAEAAAVSYDELEKGAAETLEGWRCEQLLFFHRDSVSAPACGTDVHQVPLEQLSPVGVPRVGSGISPELLAEVEQMRNRARLRSQLLKPVSGLARTWKWGLEQLAGPRSASDPAASGPGRSSDGAGSGSEPSEVDNPRHRCQITLAESAQGVPVSGRPASVCSFRVGGITVTCTARRLWKIADVLRPPSRSEVVLDEAYHTLSGLRARHLRFQLAPRYATDTADPSFLGLHVIETGIALYVFLYRFTRELAVEVDEAIRQTALSFRLRPDHVDLVNS